MSSRTRIDKVARPGPIDSTFIPNALEAASSAHMTSAHAPASSSGVTPAPWSQWLLQQHDLVAVRLSKTSDLAVATRLVERERRRVRRVRVHLAHHPAVRPGLLLHDVVDRSGNAAPPKCGVDHDPVE